MSSLTAARDADFFQLRQWFVTADLLYNCHTSRCSLALPKTVPTALFNIKAHRSNKLPLHTGQINVLHSYVKGNFSTRKT